MSLRDEYLLCLIDARLHYVEECRQLPSYCICQGVIGTRNQGVDVWVEEVVMRRECRDGASAPPQWPQ